MKRNFDRGVNVPTTYSKFLDRLYALTSIDQYARVLRVLPMMMMMLPMVPHMGYHDMRKAGQVDEAPCNYDTARSSEEDKMKFLPHAHLQNDLKQTYSARVQRRCALEYLK